MARITPRGQAFSTLYEIETSLSEVICRLGFLALSQRQEDAVREKIGRSIGLWQQSEGIYQSEGSKLTVDDIQSTLNAIAIRLSDANSVLSAVETGLHHVHNIEVVAQISSALAENPIVGSIEAAHDFIMDFTSRAKIVVEGATIAAALLNNRQSKRGRSKQMWHDGFTAAVAYVCELNSVRATVETDRISGRSTGRFLESAAALENLLPPSMRAPSASALAQRLSRSLRRIRSASGAAPTRKRHPIQK
jgi:hypothetical protein